MPELPEVEVVRRGLECHAVGKTLTSVTVSHPRAVRYVEGGSRELEARLRGRVLSSVYRRGKFLWFVLDDSCALMVHLGMSGQMLIKRTDAHSHPHTRIRCSLSNEVEQGELWFVDQRTFGYWRLAELTYAHNRLVPEPMAHIAADLLEPTQDLMATARLIKSKQVEIKKLLLNQEIVAGIGNIYADEILWSAQIHPRQKAHRLSLNAIHSLLCEGQKVMNKALLQGGTSFDSLYVNVNGQSGYFDVSLQAYGQEGRPCGRCSTAVIREKFTNRSSHLCPRCQRLH
ncbi:bifunctional DNA-formamidopyrimidine glycosylase/DNA-(apurinic or apyrimidinic site) lyase [Corynebacterium silvaticum]|uniref:Bifunctional DNA-formamidopyrimidine glycosylase/DNA-(Apurinic or apyrimidinic site) lyase n=1 Tax=Corynebacterium silvaticum TaxID=2320431 RepID=A0A7Y4LFV9_9CORY|nr:bifunctional DNA-formamidopyrimidine glycosylase/DNA-(apurinic or apyrimidinic site) lyase [Corynebacterium silvaticum]ARU46411.1 bifunctional DNA-formamidopyrimidine glycosylase/DNA-(apurinic or apyrimidinic site) lyase [Corynebacterium silvaticum]MBH5299552.1 bifunctional DNA-formamidopyrimidine glycosylase/DNA-(apurinic or apyrimidinic site) lyase [Corynebacterium silvaticum]NOM64129.1 bifunctional DNA-formamidopyrimidine glycosylase/DNA-(apurinic or apyrimidinic site) lyase [Corynebacteri